MIIYVVLILLIFISGLYPYVNHNSKQANRVFLFFSFSLMAIVLGLRGISVGEDTGHYLNVFNNAIHVKWSDMIHSPGMRTAYYTNQYGYTDTIETGFLAICKVIHWFTNDGQFFLFVIALLTCYLFAKFIYDNCDKVFYPTYIFLCESMFMMAFNGIRQLLAIGIAIQAYSMLKRRKVKKAVVIIFIAALIHNVALVCFALFPIMLTKSNKESKVFKFAIIASMAMPFLTMATSDIIIRIFPRYIEYFKVNFWKNSIGGIVILWLVEVLSVIYMYLKKFRVKESYNLSVLTLLYLSCELMGLRVTMFSRAGLFFRPCLILLFPSLEKYFRTNNRRIIRGVIMTLLMLLYFSYAKTPVRMYQFFWK